MLEIRWRWLVIFLLSAVISLETTYTMFYRWNVLWRRTAPLLYIQPSYPSHYSETCHTFYIFRTVHHAIYMLARPTRCTLFPLFVSVILSSTFFFYVSLTVHLSITLANDQLNAQIFNTFITILYMYMFRAISCSSSGGQIVLIQHLVSSLTDSDDTRCCINTIWPPEDEQDIARNMYM